jgi:MFS family permease
MADPWFEPVKFGVYYGAIGGGVLGSLGGLLGTVAGWMAPRGKARGLVMAGFSFFALLGFGHLGLGVYALLIGQPWAIWYPLVLIGGILAFLFSMLKPIVRRHYDNFEMRVLVNSEPGDVRLR